MVPTIESPRKEGGRELAPVIDKKDSIVVEESDGSKLVPAVFNHLTGKVEDGQMYLGTKLYSKDNPEHWVLIQSFFFTSRGVTSVYGRKYTSGVHSYVKRIATKLECKSEDLKGLEKIQYTVRLYGETFRGNLSALLESAVVADAITAILESHPGINAIKRDAKDSKQGSKPNAPVTESVLDDDILEALSK